jgi:hypothetical protein
MGNSRVFTHYYRTVIIYICTSGRDHDRRRGWPRRGRALLSLLAGRPAVAIRNGSTGGAHPRLSGLQEAAAPRFAQRRVLLGRSFVSASRHSDSSRHPAHRPVSCRCGRSSSRSCCSAAAA